LEKEFPNYVIGYDKSCLDVFLDVLKNTDEEIASEVINLIDLLQINPKIKNYLLDKFTKI